MDKLKAANEDLFLELSSEKPKLLNFIRKRVRNAQETEDIYQEAVARFAGQLRAGGQPDNPIGYLYRVVINIINDDLRRGQYADSTEPLHEGISCQGPQPEQQVDDQQRLALFVKQLNALPATTRNIIVMRKLHGKTNVEIAGQLGISVKAVEKQLNRALKAIESKMAQHF